jgi:peptidoglycan/LPS O-acetylase OafA/YrhL
LNLKQCNSPSWFLSALLQLQIIAPIFILLYYKKPNLGICATILAIILGLIAAVAPQLLYNIKPYAKHWEMETFEEIFDGWKWYHLTTNGYITSFFVGIIVGFLMRKQIFISRQVEILSLIISIAMIVSIYLWNNTFWSRDRSASDLSLLLWYSFGKLISSTGYACIFYILSTGKGGMT